MADEMGVSPHAYITALRLALELVRELRDVCDDDIHREQEGVLIAALYNIESELLRTEDETP